MADIKKDTNFEFTNVRINNEVWLPQVLDGHGQARFLLFMNLNGSLHVQTTDYRRFKASATILPVLNEVAPEPPQDPPAQGAPEKATPPQM